MSDEQEKIKLKATILRDTSVRITDQDGREFDTVRALNSSYREDGVVVQEIDMETDPFTDRIYITVSFRMPATVAP